MSSMNAEEEHIFWEEVSSKKKLLTFSEGTIK